MMWKMLVLALLVLLGQQAHAAEQPTCGLAVCFVVDSSSSINTNSQDEDGTFSGNSPTTYQNVVKPFLRNLATRIQTLAGGQAQFGGSYFGTNGQSFPAPLGANVMTANMASFNTSVNNLRCPVCQDNCGGNCCQCGGLNCLGCSDSLSQCRRTCPTSFTNMDAGIRRCDNGAGGGTIYSAASGKPRLVLMITDGSPNRKIQSSPPASGVGSCSYNGLRGWPSSTTCSSGADLANLANNKYSCGGGGTDASYAPPDILTTSCNNGRSLSPCAGQTVGNLAANIRASGTTFISIGVGAASNADFLSNISSQFYLVSGGFNDLDNKINEILATVCSDVGVTKTATPTTTTVGQQVTYTITLTNNGSFAAPVNFTDTFGAPSMQYQLPVTTMTTSTGPTPAPACSIVGGSLQCTWSQNIPVGAMWRIQYTVIAQSVGVKPNTVVLGNRDGTESNNRANWTVTVSPTCAFPESLTATRPNCSDTSAYNTSRDNVVLPLCGNVVCANAFQDNCCLPWDVAIAKTVTPPNGIVSSPFTYTVLLSSVGQATAPQPITFEDTLPAGLTFLAVTTKPANTTCTQAVGVDGRVKITCVTPQTLAAGSSLSFAYTVAAATSPALVVGTPLVNRAIVPRMDSNMTNNNATANIVVYGICGNPFGNGTAGICPSGTYRPPTIPATTRIVPPATFQQVCCIARLGGVGDYGVESVPCTTYTTNTLVTLPFTVTAFGPQFANSTNVRFTWRADLQLTAIRVMPTTFGTGGCPAVLPPLGPGTTNNTVTCVLPSTNFDTPTAQVTYLLDFQLGSATVKYPVASDLSWDAGAFNDTILVNNQVETCVDVLPCPPFQIAVNGTCTSAPCNTCPEANPTVYMSTGGGAKPPNGLWRITAFDATSQAMRPDFLCQLDSIPITAQVGDIAVLPQGDIVYIDTEGRLRWIPGTSLPAPSNPNAPVLPKCPSQSLQYQVSSNFSIYAERPAGFTGLTVGYRSDLLIATTGNGWLIPLSLSNDTNGLLKASPADQPIYWPCRFNATGSGITNTGGTDLTAGPDFRYYRWCAQDVSSFGGMDYVGTRFNTVLNNGYYQLDGTNGEFVSYGLAAGLGANAGSFCTSSSVIGTGVYLNAAEGAVSGSYTNFWTYGVANSVSVPGVGFGTTTSSSTLAALVARTASNGPTATDGFNIPQDALRVNGAANRPKCPA